MSKMTDALKMAERERLDVISPITEKNKFSTNNSREGKMRKSWLMWILVVAVITVFAVFNYREGKDAVPLSEIFPDEEVLPVDVAYEFMPEGTSQTEAKKISPVVQEVKAAAPAAAPVQKLTSIESVSKVNPAAYTIQIASFKDKKLAEEALADIKLNIPSAYLASRDLGDKGVWHRIYAGQFEKKSEADVSLNDIKKNYNSSFIISPMSSK